MNQDLNQLIDLLMVPQFVKDRYHCKENKENINKFRKNKEITICLFDGIEYSAFYRKANVFYRINHSVFVRINRGLFDRIYLFF